MTDLSTKLKAEGWLREQLAIDGDWRNADGGATHPVENPATGETIGTIAWAGASETTAAIDAAQAAFLKWREVPNGERSALMRRMAAIVRENVEPLAALMTLEQGKPLKESRVEIELGASYLEWFAEQARRINGEILPSPWKGRQVLVQREPVGVAAAITPWNFPFSMLARKVAPALAAGCTVVVKPAELTPYCGLLWAVLAKKAGLPDGVVNVVTGDSAAIGGALTADERVRKLSFTGSTRVGQLLYQQCGPTLKRLSLELGGNAPFIVFDDADLDAAVDGAMAAKFRNAGQACVGVNRFYVQAGVYDAFVERFTARVEALKVGDGFQDGTDVGPLINVGAVAKVRAHIDDAVGKGAALLTGGGVLDLGPNFLAPTVVSGATADMRIATEETFGPLAAIFRFETEAEATAAANATEFGLVAYFYSTDLARTFRVTAALESGMVGINAGMISNETVPFGGVKYSGIGREGSAHGIEEYLTLKYLSLGGL